MLNVSYIDCAVMDFYQRTRHKICVQVSISLVPRLGFPCLIVTLPLYIMAMLLIRIRSHK